MTRSVAIFFALALSLASCSTRSAPLESGDWIQVDTRGLRPLEGSLFTLTRENLVLLVETREVAIPRSEITSVRRQEREAATPVGAIVGVLLGGAFAGVGLRPRRVQRR